MEVTNTSSNQDYECFKRSLICLDSNINEYRGIEQELRSIFKNPKKFKDLQLCLQHIQKTFEQDRIVLIVSGILGEKLVPLIHEHQQVTSIYVYCLDRKSNIKWSSKFSKVKDVVTNIKELVHRLKEHHNTQREIVKERLLIKIFSADGKSTTELNGKYVFSRILMDFLLKLKSTDTDTKELIDLYQNEYRENKNELKNLEEFQTSYSSDKAIRWYSRESFFYRTINDALRSENIHIQFLLRSYIFDIKQQLQQYQCKNAIRVYRSQIMSTNEFETFKQSKGQFISVNSFLSTSTERRIAIHMLGETNSAVDWKRMLFEIDADPKLIKRKPFADISPFSYFPEECEVLFMAGSIFRVNNIFSDENELWIIQMTFCDDNEHDLKDVLKDMKKKIGKEEINLRTLGKILFNSGELDLAERYFIRQLNQLSSDDPLVGDLYEDLANLAPLMNNHDNYVEWLQKSIKFKNQNQFSSAIKLSNNLQQIENSELKFYEEIGSGGFGIVHLAKWLPSDIFVAVKKLHSVHLNNEAEMTFLNELSLLNRVRHPNIITFYGACIEKQHYALVMEYMSLGSLYQLLHKKKVRIPWPHRLSIALQAAKGISYLHQYKPSILHCDIKSSNLLLEESHTEYLVKVCDFGTAKTREETTRLTEGRISVAMTLSYAAPEVLSAKPHTAKSDIYSLGMVCWVLASNEIPYFGHQNNIIREFVQNGERLKIPDTIQSNFRTIITACWAHEPDHRPTCSDLIKMLKGCIQKQDNKNTSLAVITKDVESEDDYIDESDVESSSESGRDSPIKFGKLFERFTDGLASVVKEVLFSRKIYDKRPKSGQRTLYHPKLKSNLEWKQKAITIAGGYGKGSKQNQLSFPRGIYVDDDEQSIYIADYGNHRIVKWKIDGNNKARVVAGGNGEGSGRNQLSYPTDVILDRESNSLIICDHGNKRVIRRSMETQQDDTNILISDIFCYGLMMSENGDLFVSDRETHEVIRWRNGEKKVVAGGHGEGDKLDQLNEPTYIFVDQNNTIYVSDHENRRVMKWVQNANKGIIVADGRGQTSTSKQLSHPRGVIVNDVDGVYVADHTNNRIMCWPRPEEGSPVVDWNDGEQGSNQLLGLGGLSFDRENNLYVVDCDNHRILRFDVDQS